MGNLLFIDSDDIESLSEALQGALERRGVVFKNNGSGEFDYPSYDDEEEDIDPYLGRMPKRHHQTPSQYGGCGGWADEANYGGCGGCGISKSYGSCSAGAHC